MPLEVGTVSGPRYNGIRETYIKTDRLHRGKDRQRIKWETETEEIEQKKRQREEEAEEI